MRSLNFKCTITSGFTPFLDLAQQTVALIQNGNTWSGSLDVNLDDTLTIAVTVSGVNGSPWSVDISVDCPGGSPAKIFSRSGTIPHGGSEGFTTSAKVAAQPCSSETEPAITSTNVSSREPARKKQLRRETAITALFAFAACLVPVVATAQQSLFQSGDGQTAIYLRQSSATFNLGDSKASIGYIHRVNIKKPFWGIEGYATANEGVTALFSSDKPKAPEGGGDFTFGSHYAFVPIPHAGERAGREDWWLIDVGYGRSSFYLYPSGTVPSANTAKTDFDRFRAMAAYNLFTSGNLIAGLTAGAERRNNLSDLKSVSLEMVIASAPTGSPNSIVKTQPGYYGNYKEYIAAPVYSDVLFYPGQASVPGFGNRIGIDLFSRSDVAARNRSSSGGLGIFMFKKDDPLTPIGGISASYDGTKLQLALTAGFTFAK